MPDRIDEDLGLRNILEYAAPSQEKSVLEAEDPVTRAAAAKKGWDKRGRGHKQRSGKRGHSTPTQLEPNFPHYISTPQGLKDEYNSLQGWRQAALERGHQVKLTHAGRYSHSYVAVDQHGKQVGHFNQDLTVASKHQGRFY